MDSALPKGGQALWLRVVKSKSGLIEVPLTLRAHISTKEQNFQMIFIAFS
jgi:hypothetical protein